MHQAHRMYTGQVHEVLLYKTRLFPESPGPTLWIIGEEIKVFLFDFVNLERIQGCQPINSAIV